jgi:hypothetical protein
MAEVGSPAGRPLAVSVPLPNRPAGESHNPSIGANRTVQRATGRSPVTVIRERSEGSLGSGHMPATLS